jgi:hypothetical protein
MQNELIGSLKNNNVPYFGQLVLVRLDHYFVPFSEKGKHAHAAVVKNSQAILQKLETFQFFCRLLESIIVDHDLSLSVKS